MIELELSSLQLQTLFFAYCVCIYILIEQLYLSAPKRKCASDRFSANLHGMTNTKMEWIEYRVQNQAVHYIKWVRERWFSIGNKNVWHLCGWSTWCTKNDNNHTWKNSQNKYNAMKCIELFVDIKILEIGITKKCNKGFCSVF